MNLLPPKCPCPTLIIRVTKLEMSSLSFPDEGRRTLPDSSFDYAGFTIQQPFMLLLQVTSIILSNG